MAIFFPPLNHVESAYFLDDNEKKSIANGRNRGRGNTANAQELSMKDLPKLPKIRKS